MAEIIQEIRIKKVSTLSPVAQKEVREKLEKEGERFNFKGYAKVSYAEGSPLYVVSVDPIEGTIMDVFDEVMKEIK